MSFINRYALFNDRHLAPSKRYVLTLQLMLKVIKRRWARNNAVYYHSEPPSIDSRGPWAQHPYQHQTSPFNYSPHVYGQEWDLLQGLIRSADDVIWELFEMMPDEHLPLWLSDGSLGGSSSSEGMEVFFLPGEYLSLIPYSNADSSN